MHLPAFDYEMQTPAQLRTYNVAVGISRIEGAWVDGTLPNRCNNPGSITRDGDVYHYPTIEAGWSALLKLLADIVNGRVKGYSPDMDWRAFGEMYVAGGKTPHAYDRPAAWGEFVAEHVGADPSKPIGDYILRGLLAGDYRPPAPAEPISPPSPQAPELQESSSSSPSPSPAQPEASEPALPRRPDQTQEP